MCARPMLPPLLPASLCSMFEADAKAKDQAVAKAKAKPKAKAKGRGLGKAKGQGRHRGQGQKPTRGSTPYLADYEKGRVSHIKTQPQFLLSFALTSCSDRIQLRAPMV